MTIVNPCIFYMSVSNGITNVNNKTRRMAEWFNNTHFFTSISCFHFMVFLYHKYNWCEREHNERLGRFVSIIVCYICRMLVETNNLNPIQCVFNRLMKILLRLALHSVRLFVSLM